MVKPAPTRTKSRAPVSLSPVKALSSPSAETAAAKPQVANPAPAKAPLAEIIRLNAELSSITGGQASYTMDFSHYEQVPFNVQQQVVAKAKVAHDEDE